MNNYGYQLIDSGDEVRKMIIKKSLGVDKLFEDEENYMSTDTTTTTTQEGPKVLRYTKNNDQ
jgi:hypothetical protein